MQNMKSRYSQQSERIYSENTPSGFVIQYNVTQHDTHSDGAEVGSGIVSVFFNNNAQRPRAVLQSKSGMLDVDRALASFEQ